MAEFNPINTQEEFDEAIKQRLTRERAKYSDYDALKAAAADYGTKEADYKAQISRMTEELETAKTSLAEREKTLADRDTELASAQLASRKVQIALAAGLPYEFAARLSGTDDESLAKDAETLAALIHKGAPGKNPEQPEVDPSKAKIAQMYQGNPWFKK